MKLTRITALCVSLIMLTALFAMIPSVTAEALTEQIVTVGSTPAPVRSGASVSDAQIASASSNNTFRLLETRTGADGREWYKVRYSASTEGWISSVYATAGTAYSTDVDPYTQYLERMVVVTDNEFVLRAQPGTTKPEVARVSRNDRMVVLDHDTDAGGITWYEVRYGSVQGWIRRTAVSMTNICSSPAPIDGRKGDIPVIFLSPSRQPANPYAAGNTNECEQMTRVAVELQKILESRYECKVILSDYETPIGKYGRPLKAAQLGADVYVAIHSNAGGSAGSGYGPQGYYYPSGQSRQMAENMVNRIAAITPFSDNAKNVINGMNYLGGVGYGEVRDPGGYGMISILLEVEFHDHADSAMWIINNTEPLARAIADGLNDTFRFRAKESEPVTTTTTTTTAAPTTTTTTTTTTTRNPFVTGNTLWNPTGTRTTTTTGFPVPTTAAPTTTTTTTAPTTTTTTTTAPTQPTGVVRAGGSGRVETAAQISAMGWDAADTVIIASGSSYPDALAGVPLSVAADAPILLTYDRSGAEEALLAEIERLGAHKAYILGGTAAVSSETESDLCAVGLDCIRLAGSDRFATGIAVAKELYALTEEPFETIYFAAANNYPDALAISPVAAMGSDPVLYISPNGGIDKAVAEYVFSTGCRNAVVLGGTSAVSEHSAQSIAGLGLTLERISGGDRYATSLAVAERFADRFAANGAALATGRDFPDALAGGAHAAKLRVPVLLTGAQVSDSLINYAASRGEGAVYVYGGTAAVSDEVAQAVNAALNG